MSKAKQTTQQCFCWTKINTVKGLKMTGYLLIKYALNYWDIFKNFHHLFRVLNIFQFHVPNTPLYFFPLYRAFWEAALRWKFSSINVRNTWYAAECQLLLSFKAYGDVMQQMLIQRLWPRGKFTWLHSKQQSGRRFRNSVNDTCVSKHLSPQIIIYLHFKSKK